MKGGTAFLTPAQSNPAKKGWLLIWEMVSLLSGELSIPRMSNFAYRETFGLSGKIRYYSQLLTL